MTFKSTCAIAAAAATASTSTTGTLTSGVSALEIKSNDGGPKSSPGKFTDPNEEKKKMLREQENLKRFEKSLLLGTWGPMYHGFHVPGGSSSDDPSGSGSIANDDKKDVNGGFLNRLYLYGSLYGMGHGIPVHASSSVASSSDDKKDGDTKTAGVMSRLTGGRLTGSQLRSKFFVRQNYVVDESPVDNLCRKEQEKITVGLQNRSDNLNELFDELKVCQEKVAKISMDGRYW